MIRRNPCNQRKASIPPLSLSSDETRLRRLSSLSLSLSLSLSPGHNLCSIGRGSEERQRLGRGKKEKRILCLESPCIIAFGSPPPPKPYDDVRVRNADTSPLLYTRTNPQEPTNRPWITSQRRGEREGEREREEKTLKKGGFPAQSSSFPLYHYHYTCARG